MAFNLPTCLTFVRIAFIPIIIIVFYLPWQGAKIACAAIFSLAALTDWLDGYLARKMGQATPFGAFLDPVADKLMVVVVLVLLVQFDPSPFLAIPAAVIIGREITIASLREWMAELGERSAVKVSWLGKAKTTAQMIALVMLLLAGGAWTVPARTLGYVLLYIAAFLTLWSMVGYLRAAMPSLLKDS
jgi:CDP-diacylglycerol--glycerol-3-phosphate 3-phosphatidyltransferase